MVEHVERLHADRESDVFLKLKGSEQAHVHIEVARPTELVPGLRGDAGETVKAGGSAVEPNCRIQAGRLYCSDSATGLRGAAARDRRRQNRAAAVSESAV